jgi:hypothetical protein
MELVEEPPPLARNSDSLVMFSVSQSEGIVSLVSVWSTTTDLRAGPRRSTYECLSPGELTRRLAELVPLLCRNEQAR